MKHYATVVPSEAALEDLVRQEPSLIEPGLRFVEHQRRTLGGRLDVLLIDGAGALVVVELKVVEDDGMLLQALDYYDYVVSQREVFARLFPSMSIDPTQSPRLLLIAPSFSVALINRAKWLKPSVSLFTYKCIALGDDPSPIPVYVEVVPPQVVEPACLSTADEILGYILDLTARHRAEHVIGYLRSLGSGIAIDAVKVGLSIKLGGEVFAYLWPRRQTFVFGYHDADDQWIRRTLDSDADIASVKPILQASFTRWQDTG